MINKTIKLSFLFILIFVFSFCKKQDTELVIQSFLTDVFSQNKSLNQISEEYRFKLGQDKENEKFIKHIQYLQQEKKHFYTKTQIIKVELLDDSKIKGLWTFEKEKDENIYVVSIEGKVETYALLSGSKIVSFIYFRKGRDTQASFIPYWSL